MADKAKIGVLGASGYTGAELLRPLAIADVIFCRNVFIYFADETISGVVRSLAQGLDDDGVLFLGAAESLTRLATDFELAEICGAFAYVKATGAYAPRDRGADPRAPLTRRIE